MSSSERGVPSSTTRRVTPMCTRDTAAQAASTLAELARLLRQLRRRDARQRGGPELTVRELAAKIGWSHATVADYLAGKILPRTDRFDALRYSKSAPISSLVTIGS